MERPDRRDNKYWHRSVVGNTTTIKTLKTFKGTLYQKDRTKYIDHIEQERDEYKEIANIAMMRMDVIEEGTRNIFNDLNKRMELLNNK